MITGGLGFIGSHLAEELVKQNHKLILLTKTYSKKSNIDTIKKSVIIEKIDVTDFVKLEKSIQKHKPNVIVHLAGQTSHTKSFEDPLQDIESNAKSTLFILETIKKLKLKCKFILGSTFIVVGRPKHLPVNEDTPCNPTTIYGINRLSSEYYCKIYNSVFGLDTLMFRITNSFGPREQYLSNKNAINHLIYKAYKGKDVTIFNQGKFFRDLIYVSDVISAIITVMKKGKSGNLYWISSGKKVWFNQLGKWLKELTGTKVKYVPTPKYTKRVDVGNFVVDNSKLRTLGWKQRTDVKSGIQNTIKYFKSIEI